MGPHHGDVIVVLDSPFGALALSQSELSGALERAKYLIRADRAADVNEAIPSKRLFDADAAAERLGVASSWLLQRAREGRIPHHRVGKFVRFDVSELISEFRREVQEGEQI